MQSFTITDYNYESRISSIAERLDVPMVTDCDEHTIKFDNDIGRGQIKGINFDHGMSLMLYDVELNEDITFEYKLGRRHPIQLHYTNKGKINLHSIDKGLTHSVFDNEAMIYAPEGNSNYEMILRAGSRIQAIQVEVVRFLFLRKIECDLDTIPAPLRDMYNDTIGAKSFFFETTSEPLIINTLAELFKSQQTGLERKLLIEAKSLKLITTLIKKFRVEADMGASLYRFSKSDIRQINEAKNYIIDNIHNTPTVKELSQLIGMNTSKLQKGFNLLFSKSIRQFTISLKMHIALNHLDQGDLTISEIAYKIGYTNKGHFSQLFKKEFGLLPSEYISRFSSVPHHKALDQNESKEQ